MKQQNIGASIVISMVFGVMPVVLAAEQQAAQPASHKVTVTSQASGSSAHATSTAMVSPLQSIEGTVSGIDLTSASPSLKLTTADNQHRSFSIDPKTAIVWRSGQVVPVSQVSAGAKVMVKYARKDGSDVAQSIRIQEASATASPAAPASSSY